MWEILSIDGVDSRPKEAPPAPASSDGVQAESTEDEIKAYRTAREVPETVDGYKLNIPEGDDKESYEGIAVSVKAEALAAGVAPAALSRVWDGVTAIMDA